MFIIRGIFKVVFIVSYEILLTTEKFSKDASKTVSQCMIDLNYTKTY